MQMGFDGVDGHVHGLGDIGQIHLVGEFHEEDGALVERQGVEDGAQAGDLLLGDELGFRRGRVAGDEAGDVGDVERGGAGLLPEFELLGALVVG